MKNLIKVNNKFTLHNNEVVKKISQSFFDSMIESSLDNDEYFDFPYVIFYKEEDEFSMFMLTFQKNPQLWVWNDESEFWEHKEMELSEEERKEIFTCAIVNDFFLFGELQD